LKPPFSWVGHFRPGLPLVQCAANFSEGRRMAVLQEIVDSARVGSDVVVADWSADPDHNRAVISLLGEPEAVLHAVLGAARTALAKLDLSCHVGAHPRMGVVDVVPFTPIRDVSMDACRDLALRCARTFADELGVPVYLYGQAARPGRPRELPDLRRAVRAKGRGQPDWRFLEPDYSAPFDPRRGATVVGARPALVAYNVYLDRGSLVSAERAAIKVRRYRSNDPRVRGVRALAFELLSKRQCQVSMNLTDVNATTLPEVYRFVSEALREEDAEAGAGEVIGLVPQRTLGYAHPGDQGLEYLKETQIVEYWTGTLDAASGVG